MKTDSISQNLNIHKFNFAKLSQSIESMQINQANVIDQVKPDI